LLIAVLFAALAMLARRGIAPGLWRAISSHRVASGLLVILVLAGAAFIKWNATARFQEYEHRNLTTRSNLLADSLLISPLTTTSQISPVVSGSKTVTPTVELASIMPGFALTSNLIAVRPARTYRYSLDIGTDDSVIAGAQVRFLWLDPALNVISWNDSENWRVEDQFNTSGGCYGILCSTFRTGSYVAPEGASYLRFELRNVEDHSGLYVRNLKMSQDGVYIERLPNGAQGAVAFSFDWESAMGGAIHSVGMEVHDPRGAAQHGIEMRQGADWLANQLFAPNNIKATFYATGYNLLDGNTQRRTFSGDPVYKWAARKNGWQSDWWLTHKWYSDDPYGTVQSDPAWYFGDQTRRLLAAGHEVAPHTFGHLYVRGTTTAELSTDMGEWLNAAKAIGVPPPTTFAFPWRSSNSLTTDFYDVLHSLGIRAVTRVYPKDIKDQYTLAAVSVLSGGKPLLYPDMAVMPDFLLGTPSANVGEEAAGRVIGAAEGLRVINEVLTRRGTTSFWQHPEQLTFPQVQQAWTTVVSAAATERDRGRLWIDTVANITAYERDVLSVTATLDPGLGGWKVHVHNALTNTISGVTLTLPGDAARASSTDVQISTVSHPDGLTTKVDPQAGPHYPARQLVLYDLKPGDATIDIDWAPGQEPPR
jgi:peptidoglycan/xylan/chitin deacetylase (PgdA/CDA1 family)